MKGYRHQFEAMCRCRTRVWGVAGALMLSLMILWAGGCGADESPQPRDAATAAAIGELQAGNPAQRLAAVRELAGADDPAVARPLAAAAAGDRDVQVRLEAIRALGRPRVLPDPAPLIGLLSDPVEEVRLASAQTLGAFESPAVAGALRVSLDDPSMVVRLAAIRSLGQSASADADVLVRRYDAASPEERLATLSVLGSRDSPERRVLILAALGAERDEERAAAAAAAGRGGGAQWVQPLTALARRPLSEARLVEMEARLDAGPQPTDLRGIARQLNAQDLRNNNRPPADQLQRLLADPPEKYRKPFEAMVREEQAQSERQVRRTAVEALARLDGGEGGEGGGEGIAALLELMGDADRELARAASEAVAASGAARGVARGVASEGQAAGPLRAVMMDPERATAARLRALSLVMDRNEVEPSAQDVLRERLAAATGGPDDAETRTDADDADADADDDPHTDQPVAGTPTATPLAPPMRDLLSRLLDDPDPRLRAEAARRLAEHGDMWGLPSLLDLSRSDDPATRSAATAGLTAAVESGDDAATPRAVDRLIDLLRDASAASDHERIVRALGRGGEGVAGAGAVKAGRAVGALVEVMRDERRPGDLRVEAVQALGRLGDPAAGAALVEQWRAGERARTDTRDKGREKFLGWLNHNLLIAMGDVKASEAVDPLIDRVQRSTRNDRRAGDAHEEMTALGKIGDPRAVEPIIARLETGRFRFKRHTNFTTLAGVTALGRLDDARALPLLDRFVHHPPPPDRAEGSTFTQRLALRAMATMSDPGAARMLVGYLADGDLDATLKAREVAPAILLGGIKMRDPLLDLLRDAAEDEREDAGVFAAQLLAMLPAPSHGETVTALAAMADGGVDKPVLRRIIIAMEAMPGEDALGLLVRLLRHDDADVRQWSAVALGKRGDPAALPALREAAASGDAESTRWAVWAIERIEGAP